MEAHVIEFLLAYRLSALFFGSIFLGDTLMLAAGFLIASGVWSFGVVVAVSLLGTLTADTIWFMFGHMATKMRWWQHIEPRYKHVSRYIDSAFGSKPERSLIFMKFLYGTRILTILYLSLQRRPFTSFLFYNAVGSTALTVLLVGIGWAFGTGTLSAFPNITTLSALLTVVVLASIVTRVVSLRFRKTITDETTSL